MIEVTLPDGSIAEFPDGTPPEAMKAALAKLKANPVADQPRPEMRSVDRQDYPGLGAERQPIQGPSLEMQPGLSPVEKMFGGYMDNAQQSMNMLERQTGIPMPTLYDRKDPPRFGPGRDFYPMGFAPGEEVPGIGMTPRELFPIVAGGAAQLAFPPARALGALGEIGVNTLTGVAGETVADAGLRMAEGDSMTRIGMDALDNLPGRIGDYALGAGAAKGLGYVGEVAFGRPATRSGARAVEFARRNQNVGSEARFSGSPRIPVDAVTEGKFPNLLRSLLLGEHATNVKARQAATWINEVLEGQAKFKFVRLPSGAPYQGIPTQETVKANVIGFYEDLVGKKAAQSFIGDASKPPSQWFNELFTAKGAQKLELLREMDPDQHALLLARHLTDRINKFTKTDEKYGRIVDGQRLFEWATNNAMDLRRIYGPAAARNILGFAEYAKFLDEPIAKAVQAGKEGITMNEIGRAAVETGLPAALLPSPGVAIPFQGYAWGLSHSLMDPNSFWFKLFQAMPKTDTAVQQAARTGVAIGTDDGSE